MSSSENESKIIKFTGGYAPDAERALLRARQGQQKASLSKIACVGAAGLLVTGAAIADIIQDQDITESIGSRSQRPTFAEINQARIVFDFDKTDPVEIVTPSQEGAGALEIAKREYIFQKKKREVRDDFDGARPWLDGAVLILGFALLAYACISYIASREEPEHDETNIHRL